MKLRRPWAWPLVPAYAAAHWLHEATRGKPHRLEWPVISVGSLSAGGAGKTPIVIALADLLKTSGWSVDVLSRGYGRRESDTARVDAELDDAALRFGDEPVLLARRLRIPVWVADERYSAGKRAESSWDGIERRRLRSQLSAAVRPLAVSAGQRRLHLLDDGFQHRQLARAFDVVVVTAEDLDDTLLPAGNRREPLAALRRADAVVLRSHERPRILSRIRKYLRADCAVWTIERRLQFPAPLAEVTLGTRPLAFCGIARPDDFSAMLQSAGCRPVATLPFPDHHSFTASDIARLCETARGMNATGFVTTEKDAVKLSATMRADLKAVAPLLVVSLSATFEQPESVVSTLLGRLP